VDFRVADTGVGMTAEQIEKIFLPFEQVGDRDRQAEGTGLGLAIGQRIVEMMHSRLEVESHPGRGSVFSFVAPIEGLSAWAACPLPTPGSNIIGIAGTPPNLAVLDDNEYGRAVLVSWLRDLGCSVSEVGASGVVLETDAPRDEVPDLVFVDGLLSRRLAVLSADEPRLAPLWHWKQQNPQLKVVVCSASAFDRDRQAALAAGADEFLTKPLSRDRVLHLLAKLLSCSWTYKDNGLEVQNAQPSPDEEPAELAIVPPEADALEILYDLALRGNLHGLSLAAEALQQDNPQLAPFVAKLLAFAKGFQVKQIRSFLEHYRVESPSSSRD
jgi:CheY-like chemotaxis protein